MKPHVAIAFDTPDYKKFEGQWKRAVKHVGLRPRLLRRKDDGRGVLLRPLVVLGFAESAAYDNWFLYTDIDVKPLSLGPVPDSGWDIGIFRDPDPHHRGRITPSVMFVRRSDSALRFLKQWVVSTELHGTSDRERLACTLRRRHGRIVDADDWLGWEMNGLRDDRQHYTNHD